jgi:hypothetical protein
LKRRDLKPGGAKCDFQTSRAGVRQKHSVTDSKDYSPVSDRPGPATNKGGSMGQYTTYKCDKCGKEWLSTDKKEQPVSVAIVFDFGNPTGTPQPDRYRHPASSAMWCRSCVMETGIHQPMTQEEKFTAPPEMSFEDKVIMLLEELGFEQG